MSLRPENLPDFDSPPLDEVVVGVQFAAPQTYSSVVAKDVWNLFKDDYPSVQEQPLLEPTFETFGGSTPRPGINFQFGPGPLHSRLWFISDDHSHLLQFQDDRFLLNWRKRAKDKDSEYPRFEYIADSFEHCLKTLKEFFTQSLGAQLDINQAEVSYINIIPVEDYSNAGDWLSFINPQNIELENINASFSEVIKDNDGKPFARLIHELQPVVTKNGKLKAFKLTLSFRGKPASGEIQEAMNFAYFGRENIVNRFKALTTTKAHETWEIRK